MTDRRSTSEAAELLRLVRQVPREQVTTIMVALVARAMEMAPDSNVTPLPVPEPAPSVNGDRLLTAEEVALRLGLDVAAVVRRRFPCRRKLGRRTVRYSEAGLKKWMRTGGDPLTR